jgi:dsDNA-specific endonuclease/ATPase MutS2
VAPSRGVPRATRAAEPVAQLRAPLTEDDAPFAEPVRIPIEDALDLHAFRPRDVRAVVASYLEAASAAGLREVRLIHGRGRGVQRQAVHELLAASPLVERFADAPPERGGFGATVAWLREPA